MPEPDPVPNLQTIPQTRWPIPAAIALLTAHALLAAHTAYRKSVTVDEVGHLPAGVSYWQKGTFELYHHNPPLIKLLAALPALAMHPAVDYAKSWDVNHARGMPLSPWAFGWEFMYANAARYHDIYFWARLPVVALSVLTGAIIFVWARRLFGHVSAVVAVTLWCFCPNAIAHAGLVTTDMGATCIGFIATYAFWCYLQKPGWKLICVVGVLLGLAQLTKFSSLMLFGLWPVFWLIGNFLGGKSSGISPATTPATVPERKGGNKPTNASPSTRLTTSTSLRQLALGFVICILVVNAGYRCEGTGHMLGSFQFLSRSLTSPRVGPLPTTPQMHPWYDLIVKRQNRFAGTVLAWLPVPLPEHYVTGFDEQKLESEGINGSGYPVYLNGELRRSGWWYYYFYALVIKVPIGTWLITLIALATAAFLPSCRAAARDEIILAVSAAAPLLAMSFLTDINLGLRYILPSFPFWFVLISRVGNLFDQRRWGVVGLVVAALVWNSARAIAIHPNHLAYFNELIGGPRNGVRHLIDSNLDWGQDLLDLELWLKNNRPGDQVGVAYFGNVDPSILAASGRAMPFRLAPPRKLGNLRLVATKPNGHLIDVARAWVQEHWVEFESWARTRLNSGQTAEVTDHPSVRELAFKEIGVADGPEPGLYAISANFVAGLPFRLRDQSGNLWDAEQDAYSYFRKLEPIARAGYSILIYEVTPEQARTLRAD